VHSDNFVLQDEVACDFFDFVDPEYTTRSMEVIDQMVVEHMGARDWMLGDRNECLWEQENDMKNEDVLRLENAKLKSMLFIALCVVAVVIGVTIASMLA